MIYKIPVLIFISGRAYGVKDEPQHEIIGKTMAPLLDALGVKHQDLPEDLTSFEDALDKAKRYMDEKKQPFVFFVRKGSIDTYAPKKHTEHSFPLKRIEAIEIISQRLKGDEYVVATTGMPSRELFTVADREKNFYMQGSMGHAASIALGVALSSPEKKVLVLDGDGALLMHMGVLSTAGSLKLKNFYHVVLDNESYETTGDQDTTSPTTDFKAIAKSCGYRVAEEAASEPELKSRLDQMLKAEGPAFLRVKINRMPTSEIPRISGKYSSEQIAENFRKSLSS